MTSALLKLPFPPFSTYQGAFLALTLSLGCSSTPAPQTVSAPEPATPEPSEEVLPQEPTGIELRHPRSLTPWLGVELRATGSNQPGVQIARVIPGSPADRAQLQAGDVLISVGGTTVGEPQEVQQWVRAQTPGDSHPLDILRGGQRKLVRAQLNGMPDFEDRLRLAFVGKPAPEIAGVVTFQGEASALSDVAGDVVILEFWASYCGVCRFMAPILDDWHRTYAPQGGQVIGITPDGAERGLEAARKTGMSYTLASDPDVEITRTYLASTIPTVMVIDRQGVVQDVMVGYSRERLIETQALIEKLLEEQRP